MKKSKRSPKGKQVRPAGYSAKRGSVHSGAKPVAPRADLTSAVGIRYFSGPKAAEEPKILPRLFVHGPSGGSVKMDLSGVGIELFPGAFSFIVPDDALRSLEIHRGDMAIVQPFDGNLEDGQLLVVSTGLEDRIGLLKREGRAWCLETAFGRNCEPMVMFEHPIKGRVIGFLRLFVPTEPVHYRPDDAHFAPPSERRGAAPRRVASKPRRKEAAAPNNGYQRKTKAKPRWLTAETKQKPFLTEVENADLYGTPTKTCFK